MFRYLHCPIRNTYLHVSKVRNNKVVLLPYEAQVRPSYALERRGGFGRVILVRLSFFTKSKVGKSARI